MKNLFKIISFFLVLCFYPHDTEAQQDDMFRQKKERKKLWRRWKKNREAYNPYVDAKARNKPSARMAKGNRKELKRQKRIARKELRKNKKRFGSN
jgi:hypothetical protein